MSQPPQSPWGQGSPNAGGQDPSYGQSSPEFGQASPEFGQSSPEFGQQPPSFGQDAPAFGSDGGASPYGQQPSPAAAPAFGGADASGTSGAGGAQPPAKGGKGKYVLFGCIGCAVLVIILALVGTGIFLVVRNGDDGGSTTGQEQTEGGGSGSDDSGGEDSGSGSGSGAGTQDDPYSAGSTFEVENGSGGTLEVTVGEINWDATDEVMEANSLNTEPEAGETYILVPLTATYSGSDTQSTLATTVEFVGPSGTGYTDEDLTITPHDTTDVPELADGETGEWEVGIRVPTDDTGSGVVSINPGYDETTAVWVEVG